MKFIPGNYYKTRDGRKARFVGITKHQEDCDLLLFEMESKPHSMWLFSVRQQDGSYYPHREMESLNDIVSEWCGHPTKEDKLKEIAQNVSKFFDMYKGINFVDPFCSCDDDACIFPPCKKEKSRTEAGSTIEWACGCIYDKEMGDFSRKCDDHPGYNKIENAKKTKEDWVCWVCKLPLHGLNGANHKACVYKVGQMVEEYNAGKEKPKKIEKLSARYINVDALELSDRVNQLIDAVNKLMSE